MMPHNTQFVWPLHSPWIGWFVLYMRDGGRIKITPISLRGIKREHKRWWKRLPPRWSYHSFFAHYLLGKIIKRVPFTVNGQSFQKKSFGGPLAQSCITISVHAWEIDWSLVIWRCWQKVKNYSSMPMESVINIKKFCKHIWIVEKNIRLNVAKWGLFVKHKKCQFSMLEFQRVHHLSPKWYATRTEWFENLENSDAEKFAK